MRNKEIIEELNAFMGAMREGDMRGVVTSQQSAIEYLLEKVRIYEDKIKETTLLKSLRKFYISLNVILIGVTTI